MASRDRHGLGSELSTVGLNSLSFSAATLWNAVSRHKRLWKHAVL